MSRYGNKVIGPAAAIALVCFFLPWLFVSCEGRPLVTMSGWQLAAGGEVETSSGSEEVEGDAELFLTLAAPIGALFLLFLAYQRRVAIRSGALATLGLAVMSLAILYIKFSDIFSRAAEDGLTVELKYGFWGTVLAHVALLLGAALNLGEAESPGPSLGARGPVSRPSPPRPGGGKAQSGSSRGSRPKRRE